MSKNHQKTAIKYIFNYLFSDKEKAAKPERLKLEGSAAVLQQDSHTNVI